jgi:N-glycosylase/DNA lyase
MRVSISDDFSLRKIAESGQCFRVAEPVRGIFRFVFKDKVLYISEISPSVFEVSCDVNEWNDTWHNYFDLDTNYAAIRASIPKSDHYIYSAAVAAQGVRILQQDPWEMLVSFIISQRKSIPAIKSSVELLCSAFGPQCHTAYEDLFLFPSAAEISAHPREALLACKFGYRAPYIEDAAQKVRSGTLDLESLRHFSDSDLLDALKTVKGVGKKVANCVSLFGYHRTASVPIDVWIMRVINQNYAGVDPFPRYDAVSGIIQQYVFFYVQAQKRGLL